MRRLLTYGAELPRRAARRYGDLLAHELTELLQTYPAVGITVRMLASKLGVPKSTIQRHPVWRAFARRRRELSRTQVRGLQLTRELLAVLPVRESTLQELIAEQERDAASRYAL